MSMTTDQAVMTGHIVFEERLAVPMNIDSLETFLQWVRSDQFPERGSISFLDGEVDIDMSPENLLTHNQVKAALTAELVRLATESHAGYVYPDGALLVNRAAGLSTEPDAMYCRLETLDSGKARYSEWTEGSGEQMQIDGSPDLVVEIVSKTSVRKDTVVLQQLYFRAGIAEYWLIDARHESIEFQIFTRGDAEFVPAETDQDGYRWSPVLDKHFQLIQDTGGVGGHWYRLLSK